MGDRCNMNITVCRDDVGALGTNGFGAEPCGGDWYNEIEDGGDGLVDLVLEEVNYGGYRELEEAAAAGILFYGAHGCGGDYGPSEFVSDGKRVLYAGTDHEGEICVAYSADAAKRRAELARVRRYLATVERVQKEMRKRGKGKAGCLCQKEN